MIVVAGEALIDLTTEGDGRYTAHPGGGPANTAVALGRLGVPVAFLGGVSTDRFGDLIRGRLAGSGVDLGLIVDTDAPTTLAVASLDDSGVAAYGFYLEGTSAGVLTADRLPAALPEGTGAVWYGTLGLVIEPTATSLVDLVARHASRVVVGVDPNLRPTAIPDLPDHLRRLTGVMATADVVKLSTDDATEMRPGADPMDTAAWVQSLGPALVLLTRGGAGVTALTRGGTVNLPVPEVPVVDTIGAGDAYAAGILAGLADGGMLSKGAVATLGGEDVEEIHRFAAAVAAATVSRPGADPPWRSEL
jgi:fructokinase